jgi:phage/plasmid primase-like uncharacterized protein/replicative DNA helicase
MIENIDEIRTNFNLDNILKFLDINPTRSTGSEIRSECPFVDHGKDKTNTNFSIKTQTGEWFCHACNEGGDIIDLIIEKKGNIKFNEAAKIVADLSAIKIKYSPATKTDWPKEARNLEQVLKESKPLISHPYLNAKKVEACKGLHFGKDEYGNDSIIVEFKDIKNKTQSGQFVHQGYKGFIKGTSPTGAFFIIDQKEIKDGDQVYLAEGIATALTIWMAYEKNITVVSFGSANNMKSVVDELKKEYPNVKIILCLDNGDAAFKQALKINSNNCSFRFPDFTNLKYEGKEKLADFNDIISKCSSDEKEVRNQLEIEKFLKDIPVNEKIPTKETVTVHDSNLTIECQNDLINYLFKKSLMDILHDGFDPIEHFPPYLFTGINYKVIEGIIKTWEQGVEITKSQVSINSEESEIIYNYLNQFDNKTLINVSQVNERINKLRNDYATRRLNKCLIEAQDSKKPLNEIIDQLHKDTEIVRGEAEVVLSQREYLPIFESELNDPTKNIIISTGFKSIDRLLGGGFIKTELGILTGGAGAGKSAFALQIADNVAERGACVVYFSIEIPKRKLTERTYKRLSKSSKLTPEAIQSAYNIYSKFAENIFLIKGKSGMLLSEIKGKILNIKRQRSNKAILLIIDPFQRLGTGQDNLDYGNETAKVGQLISDIKQMAEDLDIPILAISDTIKGHNSSSDGEGKARGSYMIDHTCDYFMYIRTSRDPKIAIYGAKKDKQDTVPNVPNKEEDPFVERIVQALDRAKYKGNGRFALDSDWNKYASLQTSKVRDNGKFSPLLIYKPAIHSFEETDLWDEILPKD